MELNKLERLPYKKICWYNLFHMLILLNVVFPVLIFFELVGIHDYPHLFKLFAFWIGANLIILRLTKVLYIYDSKIEYRPILSFKNSKKVINWDEIERVVFYIKQPKYGTGYDYARLFLKNKPQVFSLNFPLINDDKEILSFFKSKPVKIKYR